jgi:hypothetical protein
MITDNTDSIRQLLTEVLTRCPSEKETLEAQYGKDNVWKYDEVQNVFEITSFLAPFCFCTRKSDGAKGVLTFQHSPRYYFDFVPNY